MDSSCSFHLLPAEENDEHQHAAFNFRKFKELHSRDWKVGLELIYREANPVTDHLAHLGHMFL
ncbi:hypothetical protein LINGRAHAP2_LOCUS33649 [Linum grandiflorum]